MISLLIGAGLALAFAMIGTPLFIRFLVKKGYGQIIREDGPTSHQIKRGTPTMGGVLILLGIGVATLLWFDWTLCVRPAHDLPHGGDGLSGFPGRFFENHEAAQYRA